MARLLDPELDIRRNVKRVHCLICGKRRWCEADVGVCRSCAREPSMGILPEGWVLEHNVTCVVAPCCGFTFSADHPDVATNTYSCPTCEPETV